MSLVYVCTDYNLDGPSVQERVRIGVLLEALFDLKLKYAEVLENTFSAQDAESLSDEINLIEAEMERLSSLLGKSRYQVELEFWRTRDE